MYNLSMTTQKSFDLTAKLLATENISVVRGSVATAAFDIKKRTLILPNWKNMTPSIQEMLILHEVGHALYTRPDHYSVVFEEKKHLRDYANVVEDIRIEKKMKERYPGSRKSFNAGYTELNDRDFFKIKNADLNDMLLIDRMNLYYKVGFKSGVKFTSYEQQFLIDADKCQTEEDVIELAERIYQYSKTEVAKKKSNIDFDSISAEDLQLDMSEFPEAFDDDGEQIPFDELPKDIQDAIKQQMAHGLEELKEQAKKVSDEELQSMTYKSFEQNINSLADKDLEVVYYDLAFSQNLSNKVTIPYKRVIKEMTQVLEDRQYARQITEYLTFKSDTSPLINYMIKEFEMRKSATAYKRAKISKLGQLDPRKLYAYKLKEDLFKQITTVQSGKQHGMIFLLDWSGSMRDYMEDTVKQVINLAMFCQRTQIPYQVFAFTDGYKDTIHPRTHEVANPLDDGNFNMLELYTHTMNSSEFNTMTQLLLQRPWMWRSKYDLNGTPLNQALLHMTSYVGEFMRKFSVEKMSFITLTDGESNGFNAPVESIRDGYRYKDHNGSLRRVNVKSYVRDEITKKEYDIGGGSAEQTAAMNCIIRDRYGVKNIGFFITDKNSREVSSFIRNNIPGLNTSAQMNTRYKISESLRKDKYAVLNNIPGKDEMYIISSSDKIKEYSLNDISEDMNSTQVARQFTKAMTNRKNSRVVLNKFIQQIA